jgi:hypothetical protein
LHFGVQVVERHLRLFENAGQYQRPVADRQRGLATVLVQVQLHRSAAHAGHASLRARRGAAWVTAGGERQPLHLAAQLVLRGRGQRPAPARLQAFHQALRLVALQRCARAGVERQAHADLCQRREVQPLGLQLRVLGHTVGGCGALQAQVAAGPGEAVARAKAQPFGEQGVTARKALPAYAPAQRDKGQRLQLGRERGVHLGQGQVGHAAHQAGTIDVGPYPHASSPFSYFYRSVRKHLRAQLRQIDVRKIGEQLPAPVLPLAVARVQQRGAHARHEREARAPGRRRRGVHAQVVLPAVVAQQHVNLAQLQRRGRRVLLVEPAHGAAADEHLGLGEKPVGKGAVATALRQRDATDQDAAVRRAAQVELRALEVELLEAAREQGARRQCQHHTRQLQRRPALRVEQRHLAQLEGRNQPRRAPRDRTNAHRHPHDARGLRLQGRTKVPDARHNPAMQTRPHDGQQQPERQQQAQRPARAGGDDANKARGACGGGGHWRT